MDLTDSKNCVAHGYDDMAVSYNSWAVSKTSPRDVYISKLLNQIAPGSRVLELGCGGGVPVTKCLVQHTSSDIQSPQGSVVANDISSQQIAIARSTVPGAEYIHGDMTRLEIPGASLDAVVAFFSIFHLPRDEQPNMFHLISKWLKPKGLLTGSLGTSDAAQISGNFFGKDMFWSSFDVERNRNMITDTGMTILEEEILKATDSDDTEDPDHGVEFWWFIARN